MQVVLTKTIDKIGKKGEIKEVKSGYAKNYLLPRGLAMMATQGGAEKVGRRCSSRPSARGKKKQAFAEKSAQKMNGNTVIMRAKANDAEKLFGSIHSQDVVKRLNKRFKVELSAHQIKLGAPIRELGKHEARVELMDGVGVDIVIDVQKE